jgi:hypothetical protein
MSVITWLIQAALVQKSASGETRTRSLQLSPSINIRLILYH